VHMEEVSEAIAPLIDDELIDDVLYEVKSGKEATLFCCRGARRAHADLVAVKVYKPQQFRSFRNDSVYQAGRVILNRRDARAVAKRTRFGHEVKASMWTNTEYQTLRVLHRAGARVPKPIGHSAGAVAMEWIGDDEIAAPQLKNVELSRDEAQALCEAVLAEIELWLACNIVHGDLSAYNLLYDGQRLVAIDFPQASDPRFNENAYELLARDIGNVTRYFARWVSGLEPDALAADLWERFLSGAL
jgi:RIO kinase 1